ncbi:MAG: hypothetical protein KF744_05310 [Taibaiella sp.]|nr:hypothetical protein [Taibaiella sp.]
MKRYDSFQKLKAAPKAAYALNKLLQIEYKALIEELRDVFLKQKAAGNASKHK